MAVEPASYPTMQRRRIGRAGLDVSVLGLGAAPLGGMYAPVTDNDACETVGAAVRGGITLLDVAPHYGQGLAEQRLGRGLARLQHDRCVVSTKVGRLLEPSDAPATTAMWPEALPYCTIYDTSRAGILRSIEDSRSRTGLAQFEILLLHDPDRYAEDTTSLAGIIAAAYATLAELREAGVVRAIGLGVNSPEACHIALDLGAWDCFLLAGCYSVLRQSEAGLLARCQQSATAVLIGGPYMSGALAGGSTWRYRPIPADVAVDIARLRALCAAYGIPMAAAALQFPLLNHAVAAVVTGMRSAAEVRENLALLHHPIPPAFWRHLVTEGIVREDQLAAPHPGRSNTMAPLAPC